MHPTEELAEVRLSPAQQHRFNVAKLRFLDHLAWAQDVMAHMNGVDKRDPQTEATIYELAQQIIRDAPQNNLFWKPEQYEEYNDSLYQRLPGLKHVQSPTERTPGWY